jgi:NADH pyrophosphatase NudC (nudix superfamily)
LCFETVILVQGRWNLVQYSLVAGFVEIRETQMMAVVNAKDVKEES